MERKLAQWIGSDLARGEKIEAASASQSRSVFRKPSFFLAVALGGVIGGWLSTLTDALGQGLLVGLGAGVVVGIWSQREARQPATTAMPAGPWPVVAVTNQRFLLVRQPSFGRQASIAVERPASDVASIEVAGRGIFRPEATFKFVDGEEVHLTVRNLDAIKSALRL